MASVAGQKVASPLKFPTVYDEVRRLLATCWGIDRCGVGDVAANVDDVGCAADGYCVALLLLPLLLLLPAAAGLRQRPRIFRSSPPRSTSRRMSFETVTSPLYMYWTSVAMARRLRSGGSTTYSIAWPLLGLWYRGLGGTAAWCGWLGDADAEAGGLVSNMVAKNWNGNVV